MKIAFVNDTSQHLGVQAIISILKAGGHEAKVFMDPQLFDDLYIHLNSLSKMFDYKRQLIDELKAYKPDLIGISVVTFYYQWASLIAQMIKQEMDVPIIFGGIHPTMVPERVIKNNCVDMVCVGEGEYPMLELANSMGKGQIDYSIKNIWFKRNGQVIQNEVRPLIEDLDSLPMPDGELYYLSVSYFSKSYAIVTTRGCPYACTFCSHSHIHKLYRGKGRYLRQRSVKNVIQELMQAKQKYKLRTIMFIDDCFGYDINWLRDFSDEYRKRVSLRFFCIMHPDHISRDSLKYLKNAGCRSISLGIQTWDEEVRSHLFNRKVSNDVMKNAIRLILNERIEVLADNLFGFPEYDNEKYIKSLLEYTYVKPTRNYFYQLKYYPNTVLAREAKEKGWISSSRYEDLLDGKDLDNLRIDTGIERKNKKDKNLLKMQTLFIVMDLIPIRVTRYIVQHKLYRYLPTLINPALLTICRTLITFDLETRVFRASMILKYLYFIQKKFFNININKKLPNKNNESSLCK